MKIEKIEVVKLSANEFNSLQNALRSAQMNSPCQHMNCFDVECENCPLNELRQAYVNYEAKFREAMQIVHKAN